jgi:hypothetical protein
MDYSALQRLLLQLLLEDKVGGVCGRAVISSLVLVAIMVYGHKIERRFVFDSWCSDRRRRPQYLSASTTRSLSMICFHPNDDVSQKTITSTTIATSTNNTKNDDATNPPPPPATTITTTLEEKAVTAVTSTTCSLSSRLRLMRGPSSIHRRERGGRTFQDTKRRRVSPRHPQPVVARPLSSSDTIRIRSSSILTSTSVIIPSAGASASVVVASESAGEEVEEHDNVVYVVDTITGNDECRQDEEADAGDHHHPRNISPSPPALAMLSDLELSLDDDDLLLSNNTSCCSLSLEEATRRDSSSRSNRTMRSAAVGIAASTIAQQLRRKLLLSKTGRRDGGRGVREGPPPSSIRRGGADRR